MGRRPRSNQHERCRPPDAQKSGKAVAWLVVFLVTFGQAAYPSLCPGEQSRMTDAGSPGEPQAPVPVETWADAAEGVEPLAAFPAPATGQKRPPCPAETREGSGACWQKSARKPPCAYFEVEDAGACYMAVPERPMGRPVAGGAP